MASIQALFTFDTGLNGWYQDTNNRWYHDPTAGNPGGCLVLTTLGALNQETLDSYLYIPGNYEALGIPAGSIITGFRLSSFDSISLTYPTSTTNMRVGPLVMGGQTLVPAVTYTSTSNWNTASQTAAITGLSIPSNTETGLQLQYLLSRSFNYFGYNSSFAIDNVSFVIDYIPPGNATLSTTEQNVDSVTIVITSALPTIAAVLNAIETGADAMTSSGVVQLAASLNATELGQDSFAGSAAARLAASLSVTESNKDNFDATLYANIAAILNAAETGQDTIASSGVVQLAASLNATETGIDNFASSLAAQLAASLNATETGTDSFAGSGIVAPLPGLILNATETGQDNFASSLAVQLAASLNATESGQDNFASSLAVQLAAALNATESGADSFVSSGNVIPFPIANLNATEAGKDSFASSLAAQLAASLNATESGQDTMATTLSTNAAATLNATETGQDNFAGSGNVVQLPVNAALSATESSQDNFVSSGNVIPFPAGATLYATETGQDTSKITSRILPDVVPPAPQQEVCVMPDYIQYITTEHRKPKFEATVDAITKILGQLQVLLCGMPAAFDVDTAIGVQLDAVGIWVGRSRFIRTPLPNVYFSWDDVAEKGWDNGVWKAEYDPDSGLTSLPDEAYRTLLKAKIAANHWDGTIPGAYAVWSEAYTNSYLMIQDMQDMSMIVGITGQPLSSVDSAIITQGYIPLKPEGVRIRYYAVSPAAAPLFALDVETSDTLAGLGVGYWPTILYPAA